jgi:hypothetical protein
VKSIDMAFVSMHTPLIVIACESAFFATFLCVRLMVDSIHHVVCLLARNSDLESFITSGNPTARQCSSAKAPARS